MYSAYKKTAAFGLALLLAFPLIFSVIILLQQKALHENRHAKFETEKIETISVAAKHINWVKKEKEIIIDGKYFDVKSYKTDGDNILLTGYYDHKEDKLVNQIKQIFHQKKAEDSPLNQLAVKFLFFPVFTPNSGFAIENGWQPHHREFYVYAESIPQAPHIAFSLPPEL